MRHLLALGILGLAIGGFALLMATRPEPPGIEARERVWPVEVMTVTPGTARPTLTLYGRLEAPDRIRAASPVAGRVLEVKVRDGDRVEAGRLLARLDPRDVRPQLEQARAELERERVRLKHDRQALEQERTLLALARKRLERLERLHSARLGAESAVDEAREEVARARLAVAQREQLIEEQPARAAQLQARLTEAVRDAERGDVVAPFAARIGAVEVAAGDQVQPGETLLTLYASNALYLRAKLPVRYAAELRRALDAGRTLRAHGRFGASKVMASLERLGGEADARGVDALLRVDEADDIPVGAFVSVVLERPEVEEVLSLPFSALHGGDRIYAVRDGRLVGRRVQRIGENRVGDEPRVLVRVPGLEPGETVMITHLPNALEGLAVEAVDS